MTLLLIGLSLFFVPHMLSSIAPTLRANVITKLGEIPYKIAYSVMAAAGLALIIIGYKTAPYIWLWAPLPGSPFVTHGLMLPAALLLVAANFPTSWGKKVKHPMMIGTLLWAVAHLWTNGHVKAVLVFGGFGLYAVWMLIKADWQKAVAPQAIWKNLTWIIVSVLAYGVIRMLHTL